MLGGIALTDLLAAESAGSLAPKQPHFSAKAKNVIFFFQDGGRAISICTTPSRPCKNGMANRCRRR
jgi:hypothetical protein